MIAESAVLKVHHFLLSLAVPGLLTAGADAARLYPDIAAFLIYACYGSLGGAALAAWTPEYRKLLKFLTVIFTGAATAGFVGPAAASLLGNAMAPLAAFCASLLSPAFIVDPLGMIRRVMSLFPMLVRRDEEKDKD